MKTKSRAEALLDHFPTCREAVAWFELIAPIDAFLAAIRNGCTVEKVVGYCRDCIAEDCPDIVEPEAMERMRRAAQQMLTPAFRTYLTGRLGMV